VTAAILRFPRKYRTTLAVPPTPHGRFCAARRAMIAAFNEWLAEGPDPGLVAQERDAVASTLQQLEKLREREV
jgi:hypothetical protein